jgi:hypothetical protein
VTDVIAARATVYRGIEMRSRLEAVVARFFDVAGLAWSYEPRAFANERGQYLPDFLLPDALADGRPLYVDVKGVLGPAPPVWRRMSIIWDSEPDAVLGIMGQTIRLDDGRLLGMKPSIGFGARSRNTEPELLVWALCQCGAVTAGPKRGWRCRSCSAPDSTAYLDAYSWRDS